jgi:hypothetical protein
MQEASKSSHPSPDAATPAEEQQRTKKGRLRLLLLLLVTAAPVLASYFTYYVLKPQGSSFYGQLISPGRELPAIEAVDVNGQPVDLRSLRGQWLMITVADAACDTACEKKLFLARQLHTGLGAERERLDRIWFATGDAPLAPKLLQALQGATVLRIDAQRLAQWLTPESGHTLSDDIYLVDPQGFWMMRFPATTDVDNAMKIKKTLNRLLRAAQFWDRPVR